MSTYTAKIAIAGLALLSTVVSGYVLANSGKPYGAAIFTVHKLCAVGSVALIAWSIYQLSKAAGVQALHSGMITLTAALFLILFVSGALLSLVGSASLSLHRPALQVTLRIHQWAPWLTLGAATAGAYLMYLTVGREA